MTWKMSIEQSRFNIWNFTETTLPWALSFSLFNFFWKHLFYRVHGNIWLWSVDTFLSFDGEAFLCSISALAIWENLKKQLLKKCPGQGAHRKLLFHIIYAYPWIKKLTTVIFYLLELQSIYSLRAIPCRSHEINIFHTGKYTLNTY